MSQQIQITGGAKVRSLEGVITGTSGVLSSVPLGAANGVATLDSGGKVPVSQLPSSVVTYLGTWNAATNTPTLVNGTGDAGDMYICNVAGTVNFGAGPVVFVVGDWVLYGSGTWQKSSGQNGTVTSVGLSTNGGAITIGSSPVTTSGVISFNFNGTNLQYVNGAGNLTTFPDLTGFVPYTGATSNVNLGVYDLTSRLIKIDGSTNGGSLNIKQNATTIVSGIGYNSISAKSDTSLQLYYGNATTSTFKAVLLNVNNIIDGSTRAFEFPDANGTIALTSDIPSLTGYVPYTGATANVDLGINFLYSAQVFSNGSTGVNGYTYFKKAGVLGFQSYVGYNGISANANDFIFVVDAGSSNIKQALLSFNSLTNNTTRTYTFPDASGTIALTSDLTGYITAVTATSPLSSSGGTTPNITIAQATSSANGYLSSTDWSTFNGKIGGGGTANYIPKFSGTFSIADSIIYDNSGNVLINTTDSSIGHRLAVYSATEAAQVRVMGLAPSVLFTESTTNTNSYSAYLGVVTSVNNFYTGSFIGDFVMSNNSNYGIAFAINNSQKLRIANTGAATFASSVTATSFVKTSGTSSQYLMADGSVSTLTNPVTGTGTTNYLPKFTGTSTIGNSLVYDNGTNVGIGTILPQTELHIKAASSWAELRIEGASGGGASLEYYSNGTQLGDIYYDASGNMIVRAGGANQRMYLSASGNLGLGVTPSAWYSSSKAFEISYAGNSIWSYGQTNVYLTSNSYFNTSNQWTYGGTGAASLFQQDGGAFAWKLAPSGTAGNAISFTQAMTLTAAGRLLINTPTESTYQLDVNGTGRFSSSGTATVRLKGNSTTGLDLQNDSGGGYIWNRDNTSLYFGTNNTQRLEITGAGAATFSSSVQVNGASAIAKLSVFGTSGNPSTTADTYNLFSITGNLGPQLNIGGYNGSSYGMWLQVKDAGNGGTLYPILLQPLGGNVGIGTASPVSKLQVEGETRIIYTKAVAANPLDVSSFSGLITVNTNNINGSLSGIAMYANSDYNAAAGIFASRTSGTSADLVFYAGSATAGERMRITSGGNVLIGTTTDAGYKLDVNGTGRFTGALTGTSATFTSGTTGPSTGIVSIGDITAARTSTTGAIFLGTTGSKYLYYDGTKYLLNASPLEVGGSVTATSFFESSDSRLKTLIQDNYQTKGIASITPKLYTKNGKVELGYYAQDFVGVLDSAVSKGSDDMLSLSYREVHTAKIYALEQEIKELKAKMN